MSQVEHTNNQAAKEAAEAAVDQARETFTELFASIRTMEPIRLAYLGGMLFLVVSTLIFDMASFSVGSDGPVSETTAQAQRIAEAKLNSWSYSVFTSTLWGKLVWLSAVAGVAVFIHEAMKREPVAWIPLAQIGCAATATLLLMLLFFVGFPDLSAYTDTRISATLLGYWLPHFTGAAATAMAVKRIM